MKLNRLKKTITGIDTTKPEKKIQPKVNQEFHDENLQRHGSMPAIANIR